jgi:hypothetical protein
MTYADFIPHYPDFPYALFDEVAKNCVDSDIIVEAGAFLGHGTCYMAEQLKLNGKRPKFYALDPWDQVLEPIYGKMRADDMPWGEPIETWKARVGGPTSLYEAFLFYLNGCQAKDYLFDHAQFPINSSWGEFEDGSLSFVLLNYSRDPNEIRQEIESWWPKVRPGGKLAVHVGSEFANRFHSGECDFLSLLPDGLSEVQVVERYTGVLTKRA